MLRVFGANHILAQYLQTVQSSYLIFISLETQARAAKRRPAEQPGREESDEQDLENSSRACAPQT